MFRSTYIVVALWSLSGLIGLTGCGLRGEVVVSRLELGQSAWDTLNVEAAFIQQSLFIRQTVIPDSSQIVVFDAAYDTLYAGPDSVIAIPDTELGDREPLMVEVCGMFGGQMVCEQDRIYASPKRIRLDQDIAYPRGADFDEGSYSLQFEIEREVFGREGLWEDVERKQPIRGYFRAYVADHEQAPVQVPFTRNRGRFDLKNLSGFRDFNYYLRSKLHDEQKARVHFEVYAGLDEQAVSRVASVEKWVREKTEQDRIQEVRYFAQQTTEAVLEHLGFADDRRARAYIDQWTYDARANRYVVEMEIELGRRHFFGGRYYLIGAMEVGEDGGQAIFRRSRASRDADEHWKEAVRDDVLHLGDLDSVTMDEDFRATTW